MSKEKKKTNSAHSGYYRINELWLFWFTKKQTVPHLINEETNRAPFLLSKQRTLQFGRIKARRLRPSPAMVESKQRTAKLSNLVLVIE